MYAKWKESPLMGLQRNSCYLSAIMYVTNNAIMDLYVWS